MDSSQIIWNRFYALSRSRSAFSLVSILLVGAICSAFIAATSVSIIPLYRSIGDARGDIVVENGCISTLNYVLGKLNTATSKALWDCPTESSEISYDLLDRAPSEPWVAGFSKLQVKISRIQAWNSQDLKKAGIEEGDIVAPITTGVNSWRFIEVAGQFGSAKKTICAVLRPRFPAASLGAAGGTPLFTNVLSINRDLKLGADTDVSGAPLAAFSSAKIESEFVRGNVYLYGRKGPTGSAAKVKVTSKMIDGNVHMYGEKGANGELPDLTLSEHTTIKRAVYYDNSDVPVSNGQNDYDFSQPVIKNILNVPENGFAPPLAFNQVQSKIPDILPAPESIGNGTSSQFSNATGTGTTRIFLHSNGNESASFDISGPVNTGNGASPVDFQVYYSGKGTLSIRNKGAGSQFNMTIYAPNATVLIGKDPVRNANGEVNFTGAIVARNLAGYYDNDNQTLMPAQGVKFKFDPILADPSNSKTISAGLLYPGQIQWDDQKLEVANIFQE